MMLLSLSRLQTSQGLTAASINSLMVRRNISELRFGVILLSLNQRMKLLGFREK